MAMIIDQLFIIIGIYTSLTRSDISYMPQSATNYHYHKIFLHLYAFLYVLYYYLLIDIFIYLLVYIIALLRHN